MSLLIKALNKAEEVQAQNAKTEQSQAENGKAENDKAEKKVESDLDLELSLSPNTGKPRESTVAPIAKASVLTPSPKSNSVQSSKQTSHVVAASSSASATSAANVFSSKGVDVSKQNTTLALIAGAGLIALLAMGLYFYQFADTSPDVVIPARLLALAEAQPQTQPQAQPQALPPQTTEAATTVAPAPLVAVPDDEETSPVQLPVAPIEKMARQPVANELPAPASQPVLSANEEVMVAENEAVLDETLVASKANKKAHKPKKLQLGESIASPSASIYVSRTKSEAAGINPTLMSAYEAYSVGDDANAQKLYKQVLQRDVRNVDALLGLGAIASRQGRAADANGWFGKVLEVDPRNSMAQAALLDSHLQSNQAQGFDANNESRIKNMLAKHPDDANLHVTLGNLYAEQNQWPAAQQAYFDAYSLNSSADNAFNLAVSLDQMGKPKLALPYYQRALEQAAGTSSIDKAALEARIAVIQ